MGANSCGELRRAAEKNAVVVLGRIWADLGANSFLTGLEPPKLGAILIVGHWSRFGPSIHDPRPRSAAPSGYQLVAYWKPVFQVRSAVWLACVQAERTHRWRLGAMEKWIRFGVWWTVGGSSIA
ncbi:hypothetical protein AND_005230 [Anopheles darlingi]|uniref:Uncharacterized protein n=1 Tax=Anopheles darlingi TaxID=43151 RepID=W5JFB9_ANODA|nr:hypothetical protein AND_005230 [Anopheles darlingi]